jgi:hypothetical protein
VRAKKSAERCVFLLILKHEKFSLCAIKLIFVSFAVNRLATRSEAIKHRKRAVKLCCLKSSSFVNSWQTKIRQLRKTSKNSFPSFKPKLHSTNCCLFQERTLRFFVFSLLFSYKYFKVSAVELNLFHFLPNIFIFARAVE